MKKLFILFFLIFASASFGQDSHETIVSGGIGYGSIASNSPEIGAAAFHLSLSQQLDFLPFRLKANYTYQRDPEYFLPMSETTKLYYSYLQIINFGAELFQNVGDYVCFSEYFAYALVDDAVFEGLDNWAHGITFSAEIGFMKKTSPLWFSAGFNYGLTFTGNRPNFGDFYLKVNYSFVKI